ncbi:MAG: NAD(P)-binding domain-containing protein [Alphaproteobacteria bacterium]|nr:NAD(P)-binding domain-containing protein [Alphaproteobacteria bacterium]
MNIAIIGAGNVGRTLGRAWAKRGHAVSFGVRDPQDPKLQAVASGVAGMTFTSNADAARAAGVVAVCTPWPATEAALRSCGDLSGKAVIDCTNPLKPDLSGLTVGTDNSGAEQVAGWAAGAQVFKAMNQIGFNLMDAPSFKQGTPVMFVCGEGDKKKLVLQLVKELGFDTVDAGGLKIARLLEPYALLWIHMALRGGLGRNFGFALLRE